jgi:hypothetical protein
MNKNDALGALEDVVIVKNIAAGAQARAEARTIEQQGDLLRRGAQKIDELRGIVVNLQRQLATAEAELALLRNRNADHVAVANATALTLKEAVRELQGKTNDPWQKEDQYLRKIRTKNYHAQINKFLAEGVLKTDPRRSGEVKRRQWYVEGLDPDHGL